MLVELEADHGKRAVVATPVRSEPPLAAYGTGLGAPGDEGIRGRRSDHQTGRETDSRIVQSEGHQDIESGRGADGFPTRFVRPIAHDHRDRMQRVFGSVGSELDEIADFGRLLRLVRLAGNVRRERVGNRLEEDNVVGFDKTGQSEQERRNGGESFCHFDLREMQHQRQNSNSSLPICKSDIAKQIPVRLPIFGNNRPLIRNNPD